MIELFVQNVFQVIGNTMSEDAIYVEARLGNEREYIMFLKIPAGGAINLKCSSQLVKS